MIGPCLESHLSKGPFTTSSASKSCSLPKGTNLWRKNQDIKFQSHKKYLLSAMLIAGSTYHVRFTLGARTPSMPWWVWPENGTALACGDPTCWRSPVLKGKSCIFGCHGSFTRGQVDSIFPPSDVPVQIPRKCQWCGIERQRERERVRECRMGKNVECKPEEPLKLPMAPIFSGERSFPGWT